MNCKEIRETLPDVASGAAKLSPELGSHLASCEACSQTLAELQETMALLDEWTVPEQSPYFDIRLQARLREEREKPHVSWLAWLRKPAFGISAATLLIAAGITVGVEFSSRQPANNSAAGPKISAQRGTAVGDLQMLDKQNDLLQNFDALDVLAGDSADDSNQLN